jgi:hypothetical protein
VACHAVVTLWIGTYLAWSAGPSPAPPETREPTARLRPVPDPPQAETARAEPVMPEPAPTPAAKPRPVARADIRAGARLLDANGTFPALTSSYEDFGAFRDYARAMTDLGARFVIVRSREIVGAIDPESGAIGDAALDKPFSPRARDYTGEPGLAALTRAARSRFGSDAIVMMLVPRDLDAGLFGGIARALSERGERHQDYREFRGRYRRMPGGGVGLHIDAAVRSDGSDAGMDLLFDLSAIAGRAGASA